MKSVDEIIYDAICADTALMEAIGSRVVSTCFEVPPAEADNTPLPNIIVTDDGFQNQNGTKDCVWESGEDRVQVTVDVAADSPKEVKRLIRMVRRAVENHIILMSATDGCIPELDSLSSNGIAWDWMKPCYYQQLSYQCTVPSETDIDNEQD
jgi:hypothetical protein